MYLPGCTPDKERGGKEHEEGKTLGEAGAPGLEPGLFPNIKETGMTSEKAENKFLNDAGVACLKGTSFGANGEGYIRFSYANSKENIREALERIERVLTA